MDDDEVHHDPLQTKILNLKNMIETAEADEDQDTADLLKKRLVELEKESSAPKKTDLEQAKELQVIATNEVALLKRFQNRKQDLEKQLLEHQQTKQSHLDHQKRRLSEIEERAAKESKFVKDQTTLLISDADAAITSINDKLKVALQEHSKALTENKLYQQEWLRSQQSPSPLQLQESHQPTTMHSKLFSRTQT